MLDQVVDLLLERIDDERKRGSEIEKKTLELVEEINELEIEYAEKLEYVERWERDINDPTDRKVAELNRIKRVIDAKQRMIETLNNIRNKGN